MPYGSLASAALVIASTTALATSAFGQQSGASPVETLQDAATAANSPDADGGREIVVTAQRREQRLQDVPIAVSVLTANLLATSGVGSTDALLVVTPGLVATRQLKGSTPYIRGIGTQSISAGVESPVATYVDGVYYMAPVGNIFSFNNIQRVEVLKGPQGTLFGRNTTGGLIQVITRDPSSTPSVEGSLNYGNINTREGALYVTGGSGSVAADLALYGIKNDGFGRNLTIGGRVNRLNELSARSKLLWKAGSGTRITVIGDYARNRSDLGATRNVVAGSLGLTAKPFVGTIYDTQSGFLNKIDTKIWGVSLRVEHEIGTFSLQSTTAYRNLRSLTHFDQDSVPANFADVSVYENAKTFQQEVLINGKIGPVNLTTGAFYFHAKNEYAPLAVRSVVPASNYDSFSPQILDSYAGFVDGALALSSSTNVTAGVRYTSDHRSFDAFNLAVAGNTRPDGTVLLQNKAKATFNKATFRAVIDQKVADDMMLYASFNRGFKSGLFNASAITQPPVQPEVVDAFELGFKSELFDRTLRFNVAAYHNIAKGIQLTRQTLGAQTIFNAAKGRINGLEVETAFTPRIATGRLQLTANAALMNAKYTDFPLGQVTVPNPAGGNTTVFQNLTGRRMIRSPKFTGAIGANYSIISGGVEYGFGANLYHSASFFWEPDNRLRQKPYDLLNGQVSIGLGNDRQYHVRLFGKNLTNKKYFSYVSAGGLGDLAAPSAPRTYGVGVDFRF